MDELLGMPVHDKTEPSRGVLDNSSEFFSAAVSFV
jgi:hypothetical protein